VKKIIQFLLLLAVASLPAIAQQPEALYLGSSPAATGNGLAGATVQRVTIASDNTAFAVNATLNAETTKVIGVIRASDGAGNLLTSNSSTFTAKFALDANILGTLGTAFSTAGKVDVKGADGDVFVRQATAANFNATVVQATGTNLHVVCDSGCTAGTTINLIPATSGGLTTKHFVAAASDNATNQKASAGQVYSIDAYNNVAYPVYFKLYNTASSPTGCGATGLFKVVGIQAGMQKTLQTEQGWAMGTGISYCLVKGITDADDTAVLLSDATVDIGYK
jgi:hypothetical protein